MKKNPKKTSDVPEIELFLNSSFIPETEIYITLTRRQVWLLTLI